MVGGYSIVVLLLCSGRGYGGSLMGMLMMALLVHPCWLSLRIILVLVREDVCPGEHGVRFKDQREGLEAVKADDNTSLDVV